MASAEDMDLISQYVNRRGVESDTAFLRSELGKVNDLFDKLNQKKINIGSASGTRETITATQEAKRANDELARSKNELLNVQLKEARIAKEIAQAKKIEAQAARDNAKALETEARAAERANNAKSKKRGRGGPVDSTINTSTHEDDIANLEKTGDTLNDLERAEAAQTNAVASNTAARQKNIPVIKKTWEEIDKERKAAEALYKEQIRQKLADADKSARMKKQILEESAIKGSLEQRRLALARLNSMYDNLSPQERATAAGKRLFGITQRVTEQVKGLEMQTGRAGRNVGNYANSLNKLLAPLRNIANIIPGLGISGLFLLAFEGLKLLADEMGIFTTKATAAQKANKQMTEALEGGAKEYADAKKNVSDLTFLVERAKDKLEDKDAVVKFFNETMGKTVGTVKTLNEVEEQLIKNADKYIKFTYLKAAANYAAEQSSKKMVDAEILKQKQLTEFGTTGDQVFVGTQLLSRNGLMRAVLGGKKVLNDLQKDVDFRRRVRKEQAYLDGKQQEKEFADLADKLRKQAAEIFPDGKFLDEGGAEANAEKIKAITEKFFDDELKLYIETQKEISAMESLTYETRLAARTRAFNKEMDMIELRRDIEIQAETEKLQAVQNTKNVSSAALINATNEYNVRISEITKKANFDLVKMEGDMNRDILSIRGAARKTEAEQIAADNKMFIDAQIEKYDKGVKAAQDFEAREIARLTGQRDEEVEILNREYIRRLNAARGNQKKIAEANEEFAAKRAAIELRYNVLVLQLEIKTAEKIIALRKAMGYDVSREEKALAEARIALSDLETKRVITNEETTHRARVKNLTEAISIVEKIREKINEVMDIMGGAIDAGIIESKNKLQEESDAIDKRKEKEIEAINSTALSEQQKADRIAIINARAQAQKESIEMRQRQLDQQRARFDKARGIMDIIVTTALAVMKALAEGDPLTKVARAIFAGAMGAAKLAVAVATPVPKYAKGTTDHPGGEAELGDAGKKEFVLLPDGSAFISKDRPTRYTLPKGTKVLPDAGKLLAGAMSRALRNLPEGQVTEENYTHAMTEAITGELRDLKGVIRNKQENYISLKDGELRKVTRRGNSFTEYVNKNVYH